MPIKGQSPKQIVHTEMHKFKYGKLHSGSKKGPLVKSRKQAIAIALSESGKSRKNYADGGEVFFDPLRQDTSGAVKPRGPMEREYQGTPAEVYNMYRQTHPHDEAVTLTQNHLQNGPQFNRGEEGVVQYARGGDIDNYDPSYGGTMPKARQYMMPAPPDSWKIRDEITPIYQPPNSKDIDNVYASGGMTGFNPERSEAYGLARQGMLHSQVPGRTDKLNLDVPTGSYIVPADITSALGQGNSLAGESVLNKMFTKGPYGMNIGKSRGVRTHNRASSLSKIRFAKGGASKQGGVAPIVAAGGEYVIHPESVAQLGNGDLNHGHDILDAFVKHVRGKHIKTLKGLKPPKGSK